MDVIPYLANHSSKLVQYARQHGDAVGRRKAEAKEQKKAEASARRAEEAA